MVLFELLPVWQEKKTFRATLLDNEKRKAVMQQVEGINNAILNKTILQQNWKDFIQKNSNKYFVIVLASSR